MATTTFHYNNLEDSEENSYSQLWSWYISNLDKGNFESINSDISKSRKLDRFITNNSAHFDSAVLILLLPTDQINRSPGLLGELLNNYYNDNDEHDITITPMGRITDLQTTILMIKDNNEKTNKSIFEAGTLKTDVLQNLDVDSVISGESGYESTQISNRAGLKDLNGDQDSPISSSSDIDSITGEPLSRVTSIEDGCFEVDTYGNRIRVSTATDDTESQTDDVAKGSTSFISNFKQSTMESLRPFPTRISAMTTMQHKLVLKSILFKSFQDGERLTAIRQFGNGRMSDDWLLYDSEFSLDNLQLLTLSEILEITKMSSKILFYSLENLEEEEYDTDSDDEIGDNDLTVHEFNGNLGDDLTQPIRFVQSNTTMSTIPVSLSKTSTLRTNHESIKSEYLIHKPDVSYSSIQKSKSAPITQRINKKKKHLRRGTDKTCTLM